jgi:hypothetical protein
MNEDVGLYVLNKTSLEMFNDVTQKSLVGLDGSIKRAEGIVEGYHKFLDASHVEKPDNNLEDLQSSARQLFSLSWTKYVFLGRGVLEGINLGNLLVTCNTLRAIFELAATLNYTIEKINPYVVKSADRGEINNEDLKVMLNLIKVLIHGGGFNWKVYFEEGIPGYLERKQLVRTKEEKQRFSSNSLRIGTCVKHWSRKEPLAEFVYDYLCDLVHPNKGSNLLVMLARDHGLIFHHDEVSPTGVEILDKILHPTIKMSMGVMAHTQPVLAHLGATDEGHEKWQSN